SLLKYHAGSFAGCFRSSTMNAPTSFLFRETRQRLLLRLKRDRSCEYLLPTSRRDYGPVMIRTHFQKRFIESASAASLHFTLHRHRPIDGICFLREFLIHESSLQATL